MTYPVFYVIRVFRETSGKPQSLLTKDLQEGRKERKTCFFYKNSLFLPNCNVKKHNSFRFIKLPKPSRKYGHLVGN